MIASSLRKAFEQTDPWGLLLKNLLLPMYCYGCGCRLLTEEHVLFCPDCWENSPRIDRPFCERCGKPHQRIVGLGALSNYPCADCRDKPNPYIRRIWGAAYYDDAVGATIRHFKFQKKKIVLPPLADLLIDFAVREMDGEQYDSLVPVPLYHTRLRDRGFNQALKLAEPLLTVFPDAVLDESLRRIRPTNPQSRLSGNDRVRNVRGAFAVVNDRLAGKRVLLIDYVITSGETVTECARALKRGGASVVDAMAVALACPSPYFDA